MIPAEGANSHNRSGNKYRRWALKGPDIANWRAASNHKSAGLTEGASMRTTKVFVRNSQVKGQRERQAGHSR